MTIKLPKDETTDINWKEKKLLYPNRTIRLATMFSGIGAVEFALRRLQLKSNIIFASDNDKFVKQSYFENYKINDENWYDDVLDINGTKYLNQIDLLVGGVVHVNLFLWLVNAVD
jgi:DNA (cytosine-5)-methyltransferase 1